MATDQVTAGQVLRVEADASIQFQGSRALTFQVLRVDQRTTYDGWLWMEGFVLDARGRPVERRTIFVRRDGLHAAGPPLTGSA
jgi:hypothetical protein